MRKDVKVAFDVDRVAFEHLGPGRLGASAASEGEATPGKKSVFEELSLPELQSMQVKHGYETDALQFCHHCKQMKRAFILARCQFSSARHKLVYPPAVDVGGVKVYNAEPHNEGLMDRLMLKKLLKDKKRRKTFEDQLLVSCEKRFCALCLKNFYDDEDLAAVLANPNWICPFCTGACFCSRCRRQEQLNTAKAFLVSLNLKDLLFSPDAARGVFPEQLQRSSHPFDRAFLEGFERTVRSCDLTAAKRLQMENDTRYRDLVKPQSE